MLGNAVGIFPHLPGQLITGLALLFLFTFFSALLSGAEVSFFSLGRNRVEDLSQSGSKRDLLIVRLLNRPEQLLASILIAKNFFNAGLIISGIWLVHPISSWHPVLVYLAEILGFTLFILLFAEVFPKIYAGQHAEPFTRFMALPILFIDKVCQPFSRILIGSTSIVNRVIQKKQKLSIEDLSDAFDMEDEDISEENKILKGIIKFGNIDVKEIIKSRVDVTAVEIETPLEELLSRIISSGYSRIPVYEDDFDHVRGILYAKDLLPYFKKDEPFRWQSLIRPPHFVSETKKIDELLKEFQSKKIHMAVVMNEYGGTSGIVTLEDIIEEIVGEIKDESDIEEFLYYKINDHNYIFEGKTSINDFCKIIGVDDSEFDTIRGDSESLAGLILQLHGEIPEKNRTIAYKRYDFTIKSADDRRIKRIKVTIHDK
jgi:gliding motility-associated protein GldE